jgi:thiamine biosynthesis lipoprotein
VFARKRRRREVTSAFTCFGGPCTIAVAGDGPAGGAEAAVVAARDQMLAWHATFTRFRASELRALNDDPREVVPVSPIVARFAQAAVDAAEATGGLVDATLLAEIENAGYREDRLRGAVALALQMAMAPSRRAAGPNPDADWRRIAVDGAAGTVTRPPGVRLDGGGIVKGLAADLLSETLGAHASFAVDCEGDMRVGGTRRIERAVRVLSPFDGGVLLHELALADGAVATAGIAKRSWLGERGVPAHHLLDPSTGRPAYTGVVEVTALAPTALEGEALAKAAVLSGPESAVGWLRHGGVVVFDDATHAVVGATRG